VQVPAILYGPAKEVRARCRLALRAWLKSDMSYIEAMEADGMLDVADFTEPISLEFGPREYGFGLYLAAPAYCLFSGAKGLLLNERARWRPDWWCTPRLTQFFDASLTRPWALLSIMYTQNAHVLFGPPDPSLDLDRTRRFIASVLRDCEELEAIGPRFEGHHLVYVARKIYIGLATLQGPTENLRDLIHLYDGPPERSGGLRALLRALDVVIDPTWAAERLPDHPTVLIPLPSPPPPPPYDPAEHEMSPAMQSAIEADDQAAVRRLVEAGESPNRYHPEHLTTPLFWAIQHGHADLVKFFLDHGAPIEDRADEGESPLMKAAYHGHVAIVRLLLERGAKVRYRTDKGFDALTFAEMGQHAEIHQIIKDAWKGKKKEATPVPPSYPCG